MKLEIPDDCFLDMQDEAEREFLRKKYEDVNARAALADDWHAKRKHADANRMTGDGKANPHYPRLNLEADNARMFYEMSHVIEMVAQISMQMSVFGSMLSRVNLLEGAYGHLRQSLDHVTKTYGESVNRHFVDRREWSTQMSMRRAGLDPDKAEDTLVWSRKMDELNERLFNQQEEMDHVQGNRAAGKKSDILPPESEPPNGQS